MNHTGLVKKSTTLFPQRILNSLINENMVSDNDAFRSEHKLQVVSSNNNNNNSECQISKSNESLKIKSEPPEEHSEEQHRSNTYTCEPSTSNNCVSPHQNNKLSFKLKSIKCFLCNRIIKVEHIPEHLLFCEVKCVKCSAVFKECQDLQLWTVESKMGAPTCEHVLQYCRDPLESIKVHLSSHNLENGPTGGILEINSHIRTYINGMNSLSNKLPWQQAVSQFKKYEASKYLELQTESEILGKNERNGGGMVMHSNLNNNNNNSNSSSNNSNNNNNNNNNNNTIPVLDSQFSESSTVLQDCKENSAIKSIKNIDGKEIASKDMVGLGGSTKCIKSPKRDLSKTKECSNEISHLDSKSPRKKRKAVVGPVCKKKLNGSKKSYVETPSDGFYYVVRHSVTECPNCYECITPADYTVNIVTFLMTAVCSGCSLTIYIVHDPPDESGPRVCIVTKRKVGRPKLIHRKKFIDKSLPEAVRG